MCHGAARSRKTIVLETILSLYHSSQICFVPHDNNSPASYPVSLMFGFPDLSRVAVAHPRPGTTNLTRTTISLLNDRNEIDCSWDVPLEFGDTVEIPEREHTLAETDTNLPAWLGQISGCIRSKAGAVKLIVAGGKSAGISLDQFPVDDFWPDNLCVDQVLRSSQAQNILTSGSDLSRVKVTRRDPRTGRNQEWTLDCSQSRSIYPGHAIGSAPRTVSDLVARDGDVIEVPEKR